MRIVSIYDNEPWHMSLREARSKWRVTSFKSGGIPCIAGYANIRQKGSSRRNYAGNMPPANWTMPSWLSTSPNIPTPR